MPMTNTNKQHLLPCFGGPTPIAERIRTKVDEGPPIRSASHHTPHAPGDQTQHRRPGAPRGGQAKAL